ncbi:energy-coupling factor transporter transmembrane component T [Hyphomicrobium sp. CS1GBMeth3]|uniref:energy-coupling factor transporter transmembrane component T family protein n=1 Tax=Hyphomicrobium sp. CS1GBMeth3 TaxID=1892845 RepID=UPI0009301E49|nr:energy-coupling factor transporter transmembrane component T [Hyphomicrobium sp. CS1GBMeth3]
MHWLDRVNPFAKLFAAVLLTTAGWLTPNAVSAGALAFAVIVFIAACRLPQAKGYFKIAALVGSIVTVSWLISFLAGGASLADAADHALRLAFRLIVTTGSFFIAIETSSAGTLLAACGRARLPGMFTLVLVLIVGMIPLMREEFQNIGETQRARGLELDRGPILKRVLYALARGVPLMVQTFRMAESIALALSIYGFDPKVKRTSWRDVRLLTVQSSFPLQQQPR